MPIHIMSETAPLKKVLLHRPGRELEHLTPSHLEALLFDDIPYLAAAQREHDAFAETLRSQGVEVVYLTDLMAETLAGRPELRKQFINDFLDDAGAEAFNLRPVLFDYLSGIGDDRRLVEKTMTGITLAELESPSNSPLADIIRPAERLVLSPIPNLYFTRDTFACIGRGVALNHMLFPTRKREPIYGRYILNYHPDFAGQVPFYYLPSMPFNIEGGDVLNLSPTVIGTGFSQRTTPEALELLARNIFADGQSEIRTVLVFDIPSVRAYMHLDTVFTQISEHQFTVHPGILQTMRIYELTPGAKGELKARELDMDMRGALSRYMGRDDIQFIYCGGTDRITSEREQWNDASNTLCLRPGVIVAYDRNCVTNDLMREHGVTVLEIPSSELARGRGGPRCMSMPLMRV